MGPDIVASIGDLRRRLDSARCAGRSVGVVPTMGALHDGHASLIRAAAAECDLVVTTVFVNPLQFAPTEDFAAYPRDLETDAAIAGAAGAHVIFAPPVEEMYPFGAGHVLTGVSVQGITATLDGAMRPGHFDGVATVVTKLFSIVGPSRAYFGEKDFQQLAVVRRLVIDLSLPIEIVGCATVREANGLAMSSRNRYLSSDERTRAAVLYRALSAGRDAVESGECDPDEVVAAMRGVLATEPSVEVQYAALVHPETFEAPAVLDGLEIPSVRLLVAARVGKARLIDNVGATVPLSPRR